MKLKTNLHPFDLDCIKERLNDLEFRVYKMELDKKHPNSFDKPVYGKSDVHSQILKEVAHYINSVEIIPNSENSITINISIR